MGHKVSQIGLKMRARLLRFSSLLLLVGLMSGVGLKAQPRLDLHFNGAQDSTLIFGYYFAEGRYVQDSIRFDAKGHALWTRDSALDEGLYLFLLPGGETVDLLIGREQHFSYSLDVANLAESQKVEGSKVSSDFLQFQLFMRKMQEKNELLRKEDSLVRTLPREAAETKKREEELKARFDALDQQVKAYQRRLQDEHAGDVLGAFVRATIPVTIPEYTPAPEVKNVDSARWMWSYAYHSAHYLDNIDLASPALLRTPVVLPKVNYFLDKVLLQIPDTLNKYCDKIIERASANPETHRYWTSYLLNKYQSSELIGMDAVFVHIADQQYLAGKTPWADEDFLRRLKERVDKIRPNLLWSVAPNFTVETLTGQTFELLKDKAEATILVFWEPSCSHCRVTIPKLDSIARRYDPKRLRVIGFMTTGDGPEWQKYVIEHKMEWWVNVWDPYRKSHFADTYDIYSTPVIYLLDKDHKIVIKRLGVEALPEILDDLLGVKKKK